MASKLGSVCGAGGGSTGRTAGSGGGAANAATSLAGRSSSSDLGSLSLLASFFVASPPPGDAEILGDLTAAAPAEGFFFRADGIWGGGIAPAAGGAHALAASSKPNSAWSRIRMMCLQISRPSETLIMRAEMVDRGKNGNRTKGESGSLLDEPQHGYVLLFSRPLQSEDDGFQIKR